MAEKTLWRKCGNLIKNSDDTLTRCDSSPCGYYALFGVKYRNLNCQTMKPQCYWYSNVFPFHVTERKILWDWYSICIEVSQNKGLCGTKKGKFNCWTDCYEWDENGNCINPQQYCTCLEIEVYNISGCYDDYQKFAEYIYTPCGVTPDANNKFPQIFGSYSSGMSSDAYYCVSDYWQKYFDSNYMLNFKLNRYSMRNWWYQDCNYTKYTEVKYYFCYDENDNLVSDGQQPCAEGLRQEINYFQDHQESQGVYAYNYDDRSIDKYVKTGGWWGIGQGCYNANEPCYHTNCCVDIGTTAGIPEVNAFIRQRVQNKDTYFQYATNAHTCNSSNNICYNFEYKSGCSDNFYGSMLNVCYRFLWQKLKLQRLENTPSWAVGVKFNVKMTHKRENTGLNRQQVIEDVQDMEIDLMYDVEYTDLPLATQVNMMNYLEKPQCVDGCDSWNTKGQWRVQPYVMFGWAGVTPYQQDCWYDGYTFEFEAKEYIKGDNENE